MESDSSKNKEIKKLTHKNLPIDVQNLLSEEQKRLIDSGIYVGCAFLITGSLALTGKTTLTNALCALGVRAVEPWELIELTLPEVVAPKKSTRNIGVQAKGKTKSANCLGRNTGY